jgi:hemin uptake protein HemP
MTESERASEPEPCDSPPVPAPGPDERVVRTDELFGGRTEIWIVHHGDRYRLRITRRNKLILQK